MHRLSGRTATKMNGLGNEIVVLDMRDLPQVPGGPEGAVTAAQARTIGAMPGLFFDQLMVIERARAPGFDARLAIYNIDGSRAEACGNGTRCVAAFLARATGASAFAFEGDGGPLFVTGEPNGAFTVDMGAPRFRWDAIPLSAPADTAAVTLAPAVPGAPTQFVAVNVGNPHAVFFVPDTDAIDLARVGPMIETHPLFPARVNASFAQPLDAGHLRLRVWERGAGATRACGTAACATLVAAARTGITGRAATVSLPGGDLRITWRDGDDHILMTGPAEWEGATVLDAALFADAAA